MARLFDDANSEYLSNANAVVSGSPFTMSCRFSTDDAANEGNLMYLYGNVGGVALYRIQSATNIAGDPFRLQVYDGSYLNVTVGTISTNTWYQGTAVIAADNDYRVYLDTTKATDTTSKSPGTLENTYLGGYSFYHSGSVAEAAFWDAALTDAEVAILAAGFSPLLVRPASLVAYWPLIGRDSPEIDLVGGYDMTLNSGNSGPVAAAHPRIIYPGMLHTGYPSGAVYITMSSADLTATAESGSAGIFQILRPASDSSVGNWTDQGGGNTNLYQAIDEATPSDADYVRSELSPVTSPVVFQLDTGTDPASSTDHTLSYRYERVSGTQTIDLTVQLREGYTNEGSPGTLIAEWQHNGIGDTVVRADQTLTSGQADNITDYTDLYLRLEADLG